ncbi:hypothetical protein FOA52_015237 [Chlamydomonas sp. UWO 241]|nr:hypothetical protein FOA52_015237 [Chlamydomonas sp. UWO 241]
MGINKFTLTEAVAPGNVVYCVVAGEDIRTLEDAAVHVDKAQAEALLRRVKAENAEFPNFQAELRSFIVR